MTFSDPSGVDKVLTLPTHELDGKKVSNRTLALIHATDVVDFIWVQYYTASFLWAMSIYGLIRIK